MTTTTERAVKREVKRRLLAHRLAVTAHWRDMLDMAAERERQIRREVAETGVQVQQLVEALGSVADLGPEA